MSPQAHILMLIKIDLEDDPEAFFLAFECAARQYLWPREQWIARLAPLLRGKAQALYQALPGGISKDYDQVKEVLLEHLSTSEESYRKRFRKLNFTPDRKPREVVNRLQECCYKWLRPDVRSPAEIVEIVLLEQLVHILPAAARQRLLQQPLWSLNIVVQIIEDVYAGKTVRSISAGGQSEVAASSSEKVQLIEESGTVVPEMTSVMKEVEAPSVGDVQNTTDSEAMEVEEGLSAEDLQLSVVEVKIEEEVEPLPAIESPESDDVVEIVEEEEKRPSTIDSSDSDDVVEIIEDDDLQDCDLQDSVVEVKTLDIYDTIEEWDDPNSSENDSSGGRRAIRLPAAGSRPTNNCKKNDLTGKLRSLETLAGIDQEKAEEQSANSSPSNSQMVQESPAGNERPTHVTRSTSKRTVSGIRPISLLHQRIQQKGELSKRGISFLPQLSVEIHQETNIEEQNRADSQGGQNLADPTATATHQMRPVVTPFACGECGEMFVDELNLKEHQQIHKKKQWCTHSDCGATCSHAYDLEVHKPNGIRDMYMCNQCGKGYSTLDLLNGHLRIHAIPKVYLCGICGQCFRDTPAFFEHQKIHPLPKPYVCTECGKSFTTRFTLTSHLQTHQSMDKVKLYYQNLLQTKNESVGCYENN